MKQLINRILPLLNSFTAIAQAITTKTGQPFKITSSQALAGGDINSAFRLNGNDKNYFVKLNRPVLAPMFEAEAAGLQALAASQTIRVPTPITFGQTGQHAFLVLEYLEFGSSSKTTERHLGNQLAQLHQQAQAYFGWHCNNTIGSTPQINAQSNSWPAFWREHRLSFQLKLAAENGYGGQLQVMGEKLCSDLDSLFSDHQPYPSLLHGDLWGGNTAVDKQGLPVIFDPACYFGDRETDIAMTELFGGFSADFYAAYQAIRPLNQGYATRKTLYNLYHVLNHLNLFGGGYLRQAENMLAKLLAELR